MREGQIQTNKLSGNTKLPVTFTILWRDCPPRNNSTPLSDTPNLSAIKLSSASFALPSTGGAASRILSASPCKPATSVRLAPGCTCSTNTRESPSCLYQLISRKQHPTFQPCYRQFQYQFQYDEHDQHRKVETSGWRYQTTERTQEWLGYSVQHGAKRSMRVRPG